MVRRRGDHVPKLRLVILGLSFTPARRPLEAQPALVFPDQHYRRAHGQQRERPPLYVFHGRD